MLRQNDNQFTLVAGVTLLYLGDYWKLVFHLTIVNLILIDVGFLFHSSKYFSFYSHDNRAGGGEFSLEGSRSLFSSRFTAARFPLCRSCYTSPDSQNDLFSVQIMKYDYQKLIFG